MSFNAHVFLFDLLERVEVQKKKLTANNIVKTAIKIVECANKAMNHEKIIFICG